MVEFKWRTFARRLLLWELAFFLLWLLSFFAFTILFQARRAQQRQQSAFRARRVTIHRGAPVGAVRGPWLALVCPCRSSLAPVDRPLLLTAVLACFPSLQDEDEKANLAKLLATGRGRATLLAEAVALLAMAPFLVGWTRGSGWGGL